ncbi:MAG: DUF692 family multinuclear iron-containing protein [Pseudomonadota bacterium]
MTGLGLGFRPTHYKDIIESKPELDFVEIISENFMAVGGNARRRLDQVRDLYPVAMHGVSLSIGSEDMLDMHYLRELKKLSDWLQPFVISDHLCFTKNSAGKPIYDLLPIAYTTKSLEHLVSRVRQVQDFLGRSILLENPSAYLAWQGSNLSEVGFLKELCKRSGCGILLDLNNLVVNQKNLGLDPVEYLLELGPEVRQFHIAGHKISEGIRIDTHDEPVSDEVWDLLEIAKDKWPDVPVLLERDDNIPPLAELLEELRFARDVVSKPSKHRSLSTKSSSGISLYLADVDSSPTNLEILTDEIFLGQDIDSKVLDANFLCDLTTSSTLGMNTYKYAYFERIESALKDTFKILFYIAEDDGFRAIVNHYLTHRKSKHWSLNFIGDELARTLRDFQLDFDFGVPQALMAQIAELDQFQMETFLAPDSQILVPELLKNLRPHELEELRVGLAPSSRFTSQGWSLKRLAQEVANSLPPSIPLASPTFLAITRKNFQPMISELSSSQFRLIEDIKSESIFRNVIGHDMNRLSDFVFLAEIGAFVRLTDETAFVRSSGATEPS